MECRDGAKEDGVNRHLVWVRWGRALVLADRERGIEMRGSRMSWRINETDRLPFSFLLSLRLSLLGYSLRLHFSGPLILLYFISFCALHYWLTGFLGVCITTAFNILGPL